MLQDKCDSNDGTRAVCYPVSSGFSHYPDIFCWPVCTEKLKTLIAIIYNVYMGNTLFFI